MTARRCSDYARAQRLDPVGSAGSYDAFLLVEQSLPWRPKFAETAGLEPLDDLMRGIADAGCRVRLQGICSSSTQSAEVRTVVLYERPPGMFDVYRAKELTVPVGDVMQACHALLKDGAGVESQPRDVLVCTHGSRDRCCGARGAALLRAIGSLPGSTRLWRTSHTGGHRYAPTAFTFPEGVGWAYLNEATLMTIAGHHGRVDGLSQLYRGCCGMDNGPIQALERELFMAIGWDWFRFRRLGSLLTTPGNASGEYHASILADTPTGHRRRWEAMVSITRHVLVGTCGQSTQPLKTYPEYVVHNVAELG